MKLFQPKEAAYHVFGVDVSGVLQQQLDDVHVPLLGSYVKRSAVHLGAGIATDP